MPVLREETMAKITEIIEQLKSDNPRGIARAISIVENGDQGAEQVLASLDQQRIDAALVVGITGPPGAGKSTLTDVMVDHCRQAGKKVGVIAVDPSSPVSGGAILGDRVRMMRHAVDPDVIVRSMATRGRLGGLCGAAGAVVRIMAGCGCSVIFIETVGVGQSEIDVIRLADITVMVLAPGLGDDIQAMKAGILEVVDLIAVNKADHDGAESVAMDMEAILRDRKGRREVPAKVCLTVASEDKGITDLLAQVNEMNAHLRRSGIYKKNRLDSFKLEVLDWSMELIKKELLLAIAKQELVVDSDPKLQAEQFVRRILVH